MNSGSYHFKSTNEVPDKEFREEIKNNAAEFHSHAIQYRNGNMHKDHLIRMLEIILKKLK